MLKMQRFPYLISLTIAAVILSGSVSAVVAAATSRAFSTAGKLATITFAAAFGAAPKVLIAPSSANAATIHGYVDGATITTALFDLSIGTAPVSTTIYQWYYQVIQ